MANTFSLNIYACMYELHNPSTSIGDKDHDFKVSK